MGLPTLISTSTASGASTVSITSGIDSTYDEYMFVFTDVGPATDNVDFQFQGSIDSGSNYNVTMTTTTFNAANAEDDSGSALNYETGVDQAQGTAFQDLASDVGNGSDESCAGILHIFSPSSTTYVKHFYARMYEYHRSNLNIDRFLGGYFNTTDDINAIQFKMSSGNFDGVIQMYGIA